MAKTKYAEPNQIELRSVDEFQVEPNYNVRDPKTFKANVKEIAGLIAANGLDQSQPIQYVVKEVGGGIERHFVRNHTRFEALKSLGIDKGYFVKVDRDETRDIIALVTENAGHPLNQFEQGEVYVRLRDGTANVDELPVGAEARAPMSIKEISEAVGYSGQHIANCIAVFENPPEIAELITSGKVSANAVVLAKKNVKSDAKVLQILKAAIRNAADNGKETATEKHVREVKPQFVEPKKQVGVTSGDSADSGKASNGSSEPQESESKSSKPDSEPATSSESLGSTSSATQGEMSMDTGSAKSSKKSDATARREALLVVVNTWSEQYDIPLSDTDVDALLDGILNAIVPF